MSYTTFDKNNLFSKNNYNYVKDKVKANGKEGTKANLRRLGATLGGGALGTAFALKGKPRNFQNVKKAIIGTGLTSGAISDILVSSVVPQLELNSKHKKALGTAPTMKDRGKVFATNTAPIIAQWGLVGSVPVLRKSFVKGMESLIDQSEVGYRASKSAFQNGGVMTEDIARELKKQTKKTAVDGGKAYVVREGLETAAMLPAFIVTPKIIVDSKLKKKEEAEKTASEIVYEVFDKRMK